ncbi:uncharacterized protein LOC114461870 isoform X2 [Gouania willdenowi]|uniref:GRIP and coiled-coil domain-containing protein 2-like n=1 Tax=Gouania willdenowi TaxID=441366 RepID=A0A8C5DAK8_GOUWI|nr:uncharacterized protein LOC114461870 isoform X2 [Gouania willdenowi]
MNWDHQLSSVLSLADGSVAKMRERLTPSVNLPKGGGPDLFSDKDRFHDYDLKPPALPPRSPLFRQPTPSLSEFVQWADLASIQSQLRLQNQMIESLTQRVHDLEKGKQTQHSHIQTLQEEVLRLREELRDKEQVWDESVQGQRPGVERKMEQWRREVGRELGSLRGHITRATSLGNLDGSSRLCREELEHLRRALDQLKTRLRRQEEDMFLQQTEAMESRRQYERSCKTLEELTETYRTLSTDLTKTLSQYSDTQQQVHQIRATVSDIKAELRSLTLREREATPFLSAAHSLASPPQLPHSPSRGVRVEEADSESESFSPTPSLAEISSDDLSWLDDNDIGLPDRHHKPPARLSVQSKRSHFAVSDLEEGDDDDDIDNCGDERLDDLNPDSGSDQELSLGDL